MMINKETVKCISIAEKPSTFGIEFHNKGYEVLGINQLYIQLKVSPHQLEKVVELVRTNFRGCSVSMPHKVEVMRYLDLLDESAQKCEAVNTILNQNGELKGYNTDFYGAKKAIKENVSIENKEVIMMGAGGVARAIGRAVRDLGGKLTICNRTYDKGRELADKLDSRVIDYNALEDVRGYLLINATSIGMNSSKESLVNKDIISRFEGVMDVVVGRTKLMMWSEEMRKITIPGRLMTVYQAAEQFRIYTGKELPESFIFGIIKNIFQFNKIYK